MHTVEEVAEWAGVSHEKGGPLDRAIENKQHISEVCTFMVQWETVASRLGFQEADIEGVNKDGSDTRRRRELMLERWRSMQGPQATYRTLGNAFVLEGKADLAKKVFELTKSEAAQASSTGIAPTRYYSYPLTLARNEYIDTKYQIETIDKETRELYMKFILNCETLLVKKRVCVTALKLALKSLIGSVEPEISTKLGNVNDITGFLEVLNMKMSYYHYEYLAVLIEHFGKDDGKKLVKSYEKNLRPKMKKRFKSDLNLPQNSNELCVLIDRSSKSWKEEDTEHFIFFLTKLFNRKPSDIILQGISPGSIQLVFLISDSFVTYIHASCKDARIFKALAEEKVTEMRINGVMVWRPKAMKRSADDKELQKENLYPHQKRLSSSSDSDWLRNSHQPSSKPHLQRPVLGPLRGVQSHVPVSSKSLNYRRCVILLVVLVTSTLTATALSVVFVLPMWLLVIAIVVMWTVSALLCNNRGNLKRNLWTIVLTVLLLSLLIFMIVYFYN